MWGTPPAAPGSPPAHGTHAAPGADADGGAAAAAPAEPAVPHKPTERPHVYLGMCSIDAAGEFRQRGGTQISVMSASEDRRVAEQHAMKRMAEGGAETRRNGSLAVLRIKDDAKTVPPGSATPWLGVDISYLAVFPKEHEAIYPPCTYLEPKGTTEESVEVDGVSFNFTVLEVVPRSAAAG